MSESLGFLSSAAGHCAHMLSQHLREAGLLLQGFSACVNAIIENLPRQRQTMLFSATQTKSVKDLARLSLQDPTYIAVHADADVPTPVKLQQVCWLSAALTTEKDALMSARL